MNRIFSVVWSKATQQWVVTSELGTVAGGGSGARKPTLPRLAALSCAMAMTLFSAHALADVAINNIGFESGTLDGWTYSKTGSQSSSSYGETGVGASVVTGMTDFAADNGTHSWTVTPFGNYMASLQAGDGSDAFADAAAALRLSSASQALISSTMAGSTDSLPTDASWLYQDLTLDAGSYFTMAWQYVSTDYEPFNDASITSLVNLGDASAFATVNNQNAEYALLGATNIGTGSYSTGSYGATGWQIATYQVSVAGTYRLGFMSLNLKDTEFSPILLVDQAPGQTFDHGQPFGPIAPNPGSGAPVTPPTPTGPVVIDGPKGTDELGTGEEASFQGGTLIVSADDTSVDQDFVVDENDGAIDQAGNDATFTGTINDATSGIPGSLTITNSGNGGSVTLTGTNGYTGSTTIDEGATLALAGDGSIAESDEVTVAGKLDIAQANSDVNVKSLGGDGDVTLGNNRLVITDGKGDFGGMIEGQGGVTVTSGTQVLSGDNTYTGGTNLNGGTLQIDRDGNLGDAAGELSFNGGTLASTGDVSSDRDVNLIGTGTFDTATSTTLSNSGDVSGSGSLVKNGEGSLALTGTVGHSGGTTVNDGLLVLSGDNTYIGGTVLNGGTLQIDRDDNLGDAAGELTFNGGKLASTGDVASSRDVNLAGTGTFDTATGTTLANSGDVSGAGGLVKDGQGGLTLTGTVSHASGTTVNDGLLVLSGDNTYTGGTVLNGGTLQIDRDTNLGDAAGELTFNGGTLTSTGDVNSARDVNLAGTGAFDTATGTTLANSGDVSGTGALVKDGLGGLVLTGTVAHAGGTTVNDGLLVLSGDNSYTGGTTLNGGTLQIDRDGNLGDAAGELTFNGGTLASTGDVSSDRDVSLVGTGTFDTATGTTLNNSGEVTGAGSLVKNGEGGLMLTGTVSHAGGTTVNDGLLVLSGDNTYTGGTTLNGGTLQIDRDTNLGDAAGGLTFNGGTLTSTGDVNSARDVNLAGTGTFDTATGTTLANSGDVSGTGGLVKDGLGGLALTGTVSHAGGTTVNDGLLVLSGDNTYTGGTTLNGGTLQIDRDTNLGDAAGELTFNGGTLTSTGDVNSARDVNLAGTGTFDTATGTTLSNSGDVSGTGGLVKDGLGGLALTGTVSHTGGTTVNDGLLVLSGDNTYTGGTTLNGGTLQIDRDSNLGNANGGLTFNGGTLASTGNVNSARDVTLAGTGTFETISGTTTLGGAVSGTGQLVKSGAGTLVLAAANSHSGGTMINGGTVELANAGGLGSGAVTLDDATLRSVVNADITQAIVLGGESTMDIAAGTTTRLSGFVDGSQTSGCFIKSGAGRLNMTGTAVMANGTCVTEGTLSTNGILTSRVQVDRTGTLRGVGTIAGNVNVDGTLAAGNSPGTLLVTGSINMSDSGVLQVDIDGHGTGNGAGSYSRVILSGAGSQFVANGTLQPILRGITGDATNTFTPKVGDMFRIVSGEGGVTGTFDTLLQPTSGMAAGTRFQVYYITGYDIDLYVAPSLYMQQLVGEVSGNTLATAAALDRLVELNDTATTTQRQKDLLRGVWEQNALSLPAMVAALSGETHAQLASLAQSNASALAADVSGRLADAALLTSERATVEQLLWANIGHGNLHTDSGHDAGALDARQRRASAGLDVYRSSHIAWGAGIGHTASELDGSPRENTIDSDAFFVYAVAKAGKVVFDGVASYSADDWRSERINALASSQLLRGKASGNTRMVSAGASLPFVAGGLRWTPALRGTWQKVDRDAFTEQGDALSSLEVDRYTAEGGRAQVGLSVGSFNADPLRSAMTWQVGVDAGTNFGQARQANLSTQLGDEQVQVRSAAAGREFYRAQIDATLRTGKRSYLYGGVSTEQGAGVDNTSVNAGIRISL